MEGALHKVVNRSATPRPEPAAVPLRSVPTGSVQRQSTMRVSSPRDPAEREAEDTARKLMRMPTAEVAVAWGEELGDASPRRRLESPYTARFSESIRLMRQHAAASTSARKGERQPDVRANRKPALSGSVAEQVISLLNQPDPIGGVGDFRAAWAVLAGLSTQELFATYAVLAQRGYLELLAANRGALSGPEAPRLLSALHVAKWAARRQPPSAEELRSALPDLEQLSAAEQRALFFHVAERRQVSRETMIFLEGMVAMMAAGEATAATAAASGATPTPAMAGTAGAMPPPVTPGPWAPPGKQPIPFYIGTQAHIGIAAGYVSAHPGDVVRTNFTPMRTLLELLSRLPSSPGPLNTPALNASEMGMEPDIINLTKLHLYEIKPRGAEGLARTEARLYVGLFGRAGVSVALGPTTEPGTSGGIPAPDGVYLFESPEPGVITYEYRHGQLVPVPVPSPKTSRERRWRWELRPLTPQQQAAMTMTVGTALLLLLMLLLAPVGV